MLTLLLSFSEARASDAPAIDTTKNSVHQVLNIPRLERAPTLEDFSGMEAGSIGARMQKAEGFTQADPKDGEPSTQRTQAYLGYDSKNLYVVFLCFETDPHKIRAHMTRREGALDDDFVEITLDTFKDHRHGFLFSSNPLGVQHDALWTEGLGPDFSFDTIWSNEARLTDKGWMALFSIPFRSLRFSSSDLQDWGITLHRVIQHENERSFWPYVSSKINGRLIQAATVKGMEGISPGRNVQFVPYGIGRSYRALDTTRGPIPSFVGERLAGQMGIDTKVVYKDRFVIDTTIHPDFSQVESDEPQVTVNQRFEVFFPEKRPFFLENASYFRTPIDLSFSRRIADPQYGVRLTGKQGKYSIGTLFADDASPGKAVARSDPANGSKAYFGIVRVNRDFGEQNSIGVIYADREYLQSSNRVGGIDARFKSKTNWFWKFQAVESSTHNADGSYSAGPAWFQQFGMDGRKFFFNAAYNGNAEGFVTHTGYFRRPGIHRITASIGYNFRPEGKVLTSHGPSLFVNELLDHQGTRLLYIFNPNYQFHFKHSTSVGAYGGLAREKLRKQDFSTPTDLDFSSNRIGVFFFSEYFNQASVNANFEYSNAISYVPLPGLAPGPARSLDGEAGFTLKPIDKLQISNTYLLSRLTTPGGANIFDLHVIRSKWNYQVNRQLSFRLIGQYSGLLANSAHTYLQPRKGINGDFLMTYLIHPGTALYLGYNSNLSNLDRSLAYTPNGGLLSTRNGFINDGRQIFIKLSYLFRY